MKVGILCSGELGYNTLLEINNVYNITFIATDSLSSNIIDFAQKNNIAFYKGNPRNGKLAYFLRNAKYDFLISVNYLFLIERDVISTPSKMAFNLHGSLLPKYRGRTPHVWAIINGETECGITAHLIDSGCDTGAILYQYKVDIEPSDTGHSLLQKYKVLYFPIINKVIGDFIENKLIPIPQDEKYATYFGKRTPDDGRIDWQLDKKNIYNWVRAQSHPYPGAFAFFKGKKIIIDWVEEVEREMEAKIKNGSIIDIKGDTLYVKVKDGVLRLDKIRNFDQFIFELNDYFE